MGSRRSLRNKGKLKEVEDNIVKEKSSVVVKKDLEDDGSSSDSSVENYLKTADEIDLNSSFFTLENVSKPKPVQKKFTLDRLSDSSDSDSGHESDCKKDEATDKKLLVPKKEEENDFSFKSLENYNRKIEEAKLAVENYKSMKLKQENKNDIKHLLSVGETKNVESKLDTSNYMSDSSSDREMDWEEIEDEKALSQTIPKEGVQITVEIPTLVRKKKKDDYMMMVKRRLNRVKKENQVYMHKVHLLCWLAHGNYVNSILNSENLLGLCLSLIPSEQCYPPKHADLNYLEQITRWYGKVMKLMEKTSDKIPTISLENILQLQLNKKQATSKKYFVLLFICILRALGLQCRLILSLQCISLKPKSSELCSLSTKDKTDDPKDKKKNKDEETIKDEQKTKPNIKNLKKTDSEATKKIDQRSKPNLKNLKPGSSKNEENAKSKEESSSTQNSTTRKRQSTTELNKPSSLKKEENAIKNNKESTSTQKNKTNKRQSTANEDNTKEINEAMNSKPGTSKIEETQRNKRQSMTNEDKKQTKTNEARVTRSKRLSKKMDDPTPKSAEKKSPQKPSRSRNDSEEDFQPDRRTSSPEKSAKKIDKRKDVRDVIVNLIKSDMTDYKNAEKQKKVTRKKKPENDSDDSDYVPEPVKKLKSSRQNDSGDDFKKKNTTKVKQRVKPRSQIDARVLSTDDEDDSKKPEKVGNDVWAEVFLEAEEKWISVDIIKGQVHCVSELHSRASTPVCYILAWNNNLSVKDVTSRYCPHWNTVTRKLRVDPNWWNDSLKPFVGRKTARDKEEDEDLARQQLDQPLPKTIGEYKNHPLYALKRHLLKFEAIYPPDAVTLGFVRNEAVYARECVHTLHSREIWIKHAKIVKPAQEPYKIVKARPKYDKLTGSMITDKPLEIFGIWQVEDYVPPTAENGIVPRNAFGNVELFKPCMLPKGTVHLQLPGLNKIARRMQIDCAPALVGFDYHCGGSHPTFDGFIVCEEFEDQLIVAWEQEQEEIARKELEKIEQRVYGNWKKLIKGLLIRERLKAKYEFDGASGSGKGKKKSKGPRFVAKRRRVISGSESSN